MKTDKEHSPCSQAERPLEQSTEADGSPPPMRVVGIGASAGGLTALKKLFASVPEQPGVCFVVIVHLSPEHESHLADLLQASSRLPVLQITGATPLKPNHVYVIPPGVNLEAIDTHLRLSNMELQRQQRAPIDHFFRTLAEAHHERAVGVVLTGTGADGTLGLKRIREHGGLTIVQSPEEAEYDAMPRNAIAAGAADLVLPVEQIPGQILQVRQARLHLTSAEEGPEPETETEASLQKILALVQSHTGHDFTHYKDSTILRRIGRRMQLHRIEHLEGYLEILHTQEQEVGLLFEDLLVTVTEFFRDPEVFTHLENEVIPQLFEDQGSGGRVRAWSVGCATGEEAYSLAVLMLEEEARRELKPQQVQVFASDLHEPALRKAREGRYPASIEADVSPRRLSHFFIQENGSYRVRKDVRERIVFAHHNILQDPPFSRLQLISCRNLLIYLQRDAQHQLLSLFHYALEEGGWLLIGTAEGVESDLFVCEDKKHGLYRRRNVPTHKFKQTHFPVTSSHRGSENRPTPQTVPPASYGALHEQIVERYAPPSALINPQGELVHYSAHAGRFLQMPGGTPTQDIFQLLPEQLRFELRAALHDARDEGSGYRSRPIRLSIEGRPCQVVLRVQPIDQPQMAGFFLVIFDELEETDAASDADSRPADANVRELEAELEQTKRRMQTLIEEHEAAQERSQAYNEELESTNEELRSTMEELETSKEEMQSMNEELTTLNQENREKVEELDKLNSDLQNLLTATHIPTVFLDRQMRIRRFTPSMAELLNMHDSDRGRSLADLTHRLSYEQFQEDFKRVLEQLTPTEREVRSHEGRWYLVRLQCYRTQDDRIEGGVVTFIDITDRKKGEEEVREAKDLAEEVIDTVRNPMLVLRHDLRVRDTNRAFNEMFAVDPGEVDERLIYELNDGQWDIPELRQLLENILPADQVLNDFELEHWFPQTGTRSLLLNARRIDHLQLILLAIEDVTDRNEAKKALEHSRQELERQVSERTAQLHQQTSRLQHLVRELTSAEQRERKRMASVLHDELQQLLVAAKMQIGMIGMTRHLHEQEQNASAPQDQALHYLDEAIETTRSLVRQVVPQVLYEQGLIPALQWLSERMSNRHGLNVQINAQAVEPPLNDETRTLLFESVREMLFNVVKHADVNEAAVDLHQEHGRLHITVSDEGRGFDVDTTAGHSGSGFGVFSLSDRIEALGGDWSINSAPGQGTRIRVDIPVAAARPHETADQSVESAPPPTSAPGSPDSQGSVRVLVVDDHVLVREGIVDVLRREPRITVVGEASDGDEALAAVDRHRPDIVLMDIKMPRLNGIDATREIRRRRPETIVIGLSVQDQDGDAARALSDAGAAAFISKSADSGEMIQTLLRLMALGS